MDFRMGSEADREQVRQMWAYCFNEEDDFLAWYFDSYWDPRHALVGESDEPYSAYRAEDGDVQRWIGASLQMIPYTIALRGDARDVSYIVGVAVAPELRGTGLSRELMRRALEQQNDAGQIASLLLPFDYAFYRKLGYEVCYGLKYLECAPSDLRPLCAEYGRVVRADREQTDQLDTVYLACMRGRNGYVRRSRRDWAFLFDVFERSGGYVYVVQNDYGEPEGYVTFLKSRERLRVKELCSLNPNALGALLRFLASHRSSYESVCFDLPQDSPLGLFMNDPREAASVERPYAMARVVNVERALSSAETKRPVLLRVADPLLPFNDGVFDAATGKRRAGKPAAEMSVGAFSQLYMGFLSAQELWDAGKIAGDRRALRHLDEMFPKQRNYINHVLADE